MKGQEKNEQIRPRMLPPKLTYFGFIFPYDRYGEDIIPADPIHKAERAGGSPIGSKVMGERDKKNSVMNSCGKALKRREI